MFCHFAFAAHLPAHSRTSPHTRTACHVPVEWACHEPVEWLRFVAGECAAAAHLLDSSSLAGFWVGFDWLRFVAAGNRAADRQDRPGQRPMVRQAASGKTHDCCPNAIPSRTRVRVRRPPGAHRAPHVRPLVRESAPKRAKASARFAKKPRKSAEKFPHFVRIVVSPFARMSPQPRTARAGMPIQSMRCCRRWV